MDCSGFFEAMIDDLAFCVLVSFVFVFVFVQCMVECSGLLVR